MLPNDQTSSAARVNPTAQIKRDQPAPGPRTPTAVHQVRFESPRQERPSSPRPRTGFPGVGPLEVSPNVILFVPRRTPLGSPGANEFTPDQVVSPDRLATQRPAETPEEERLCLRAWALCVATLGPFILSSWLMALPFLIRTNTTNMQPLLPVPVQPIKGLAPTGAPGTSSAGLSTGRGINERALASVIPSCNEKPPSLNDVSGPFKTPSLFEPITKHIVAKPFFCLFNNSRIRNPMRQDFVFGALPFQLCPYIVYWSAGIENGTITSRVPTFDQTHGLKRLRSILNKRGFSTTIILLALGGYQEDGPQFAMLSADRGLMQKFCMNVLDTVVQNQLDGVTVHWVPARPGCEGPNNVQTLEAILRGIRREYQTSGLPKSILSVILPAEDSHDDFATRAASLVDFVFLDTRVFTPTTKYLRKLCSSVTSEVQTAVVRLVRRSVGGLPQDKVCIMDSLAPLSGPATRNSARGLYELDIKSTTELMKVPFYDACRTYSFCRENMTDSCVVHRSVSPFDGTKTTLYIVNSAPTWMARSSYEYLYGESPDKNVCVLITDLDYDDYARQCGAPYEQYILMMNFYFGAYGMTGRGAPIHSVAPPC